MVSPFTVMMCVSIAVVMRRAREASIFSLGFTRKKKPLHNGSYEHRVPKIKNKTFFCMYVRVIQHRNWPLRSTILNAHGTNAVLTGSVHAHILTRPSRAGFAVSHLELNEPGAATCVWRHGWACLLYTSPSPRDKRQSRMPSSA